MSKGQMLPRATRDVELCSAIVAHVLKGHGTEKSNNFEQWERSDQD